MRRPEFEPLGDQALLLRWGDQADIAVNRQVHALAARLRAAAFPWLIDCVPAYASLAVFFDGSALPGNDPAAMVRDLLLGIVEQPESTIEHAESRLVEIDVCYSGEFGPDLDDVAGHCRMTAQQVVEKHSQAEYLVAMLGFSPGFPYLLGLDPALASPRLGTPRTRVPAGSVGIGGSQTGIYPDDGPGGWRLIGRTPRKLFDARQDPPTLLSPGDRVRFAPIDAAHYRMLSERQS
jgi:KipI family sensor histidine kinase inhibitor